MYDKPGDSSFNFSAQKIIVHTFYDCVSKNSSMPFLTGERAKLRCLRSALCDTCEASSRCGVSGSKLSIFESRMLSIDYGTFDGGGFFYGCFYSFESLLVSRLYLLRSMVFSCSDRRLDGGRLL